MAESKTDKKRRTRGTGGIFCKRGWYYLKYYIAGKPVYEAAGTKKEKEARELLKVRLGQITEGRYAGPTAARVTFEDLMEGLKNDYRANARKTLVDVEWRVRKYLAPFFGGRKAQKITTADVKAYIANRQEQGASNGSINRELANLKRGFNLAFQAETITRKPYIPSLEENNARKGFFEQAEYEAVLAKLPEHLRPVITVSYVTGWRIRSEVLRLTWSQVDLDLGTVRLEVGTTKNKDGRLIYLTTELHAVLTNQWQEHRTRYADCPFVFHDHGRQMKTFYKNWRKACREAGLSDKIPHDFRRTAVRNMVRAGIPERVAMHIAGHKTREVFDRYNIVSEGDLREAAKRLNAVQSARMVTTLVTTPSEAHQEMPLSH